MTFIARLIAWLNGGMNVLFTLLRGPISALPAWLSLTIISAVLGVILLILFKYTSNQAAIGRVRDKIKARLLAMKLFKDNVPVVLKSQIQVFAAAIMLLIYSIPPMLVMIIPFCLVLGQLGRWYQARPLSVNEPAVVKVQLSGAENQPLSSVLLVPTKVAEVMVGPVRVPSKQQVYWKFQPTQPGIHHLQFNVAGIQVRKELSVGSGLMPVSIKRPSLTFIEVIEHPTEHPFNQTSPIQSISIDYPDRYPSFLGFGLWFWAMVMIAIVSGFVFKPLFDVKI